MIICLLVIAAVVILDQVSKAWVMYGLGLDEVGESIPLIENVFHFTHVRNTGAAFGIFGAENERWIFIIASIIGIGALFIYLCKFRPNSKLACVAISMIIGGGIGNMIDRCFRVGLVRGEERHYVLDFLDFCAFPDLWKWTFNVADAFVCIGAGLLMVWCIYSFVKDVEAEKRKKLNEIYTDDFDEYSFETTEISENTKKSEDIGNIEDNDSTENKEN
jgi:signal peptidase II